MSPMNPRKLVPTQEPGVLDFAPGAAAAYSLRNLSLSYSGPVVTVRRSTDDAEADFTAAEVSDGTLAAWCSGGDGFVKTWHDQSQNGRDATQATAGYQPQIVDSGTLVTEGGKAAVQFDGTDDRLAADDVASIFTGTDKETFSASVFKASVTAGTAAVFGVGRAAGGLPIVYVSSDSTGSIRFAERDSAGVLAVLTGSSVGIAYSQTVGIHFSNGNARYIYANGESEGTDSTDLGATELNKFSVGAFVGSAASLFFSGTISELLIYPTDMTDLRTRIEGNLAWTYNA